MGVGKREERNSIGSKGASVYALYEKTPIIILEVEVINILYIIILYNILTYI